MSNRQVDVRVPVGDDATIGRQMIAASVHLPPAGTLVHDTVLFAFPGGGYNRRYYDLQLPGYSGYSEAEHHTRHGYVLVAIDHVGTGDSDVPRVALDYAAIAALNAEAVDAITGLLVRGEVAPDVPPLAVGTRIGLGQSYGGLLLTWLQGEYGTFDGVAFLGWSAIESRPRIELTVDPLAALDLPAGSGLLHPLRAFMHFEGEPTEIVEQNMRGYPQRDGVPVPTWAAVHMPGGPLQRSPLTPVAPGVVAEPAARIGCPVLVVAAERDVQADLRQEPAAYGSSPDITLFALPRSGHMHNFASTRARLWARIETWAACVTAASGQAEPVPAAVSVPAATAATAASNRSAD